MMWNNAGSFLAPAQIADPAESSESGCELPEENYIVHAPAPTPCVLQITRRDVLYGVQDSSDDEDFLAGSRTEEAPRHIHKVISY